jgi:Tol biopolymer transport system component
MSPEQVRGLTADHRSDVFALGTILYELLSGRRAFQRDTSAETMTAILNEDPPELTAEPRIAPALGRIVMRCLGKNPANRFQTASDLAFALEGLSASGDSGAAVKALDVKATSGRRREQAAWVAAAVSLVAAITAMVLLLSRPAPELPSFRLDVTTPPTTAPAAFALSPDGSQIVFAATADGVSRLWRRALDQTTAQPLPGTEGATNPFWAPDSRSIGFFADGRLKRLDLAGGPPQDLAEAPDNRGGTWSRDGVILFAPGIGGGLRRVPAKGGTVAVVPGDGGRFPAFLPDGRRFVFFLGPTSPDRQGIYLGSLDAPDARRLVPADVAGAYVVPGYLLMQRQGVLVAVPFDATREAIMGDPIPIAQTAGVDFGFFRSAFSVSATGLLAYRTGTERRQLVWNDRRGNDVGTLGPPDETDRLYPEVAPDGLSVAIQRFVKGNFDLWLIDGRGVWDPFTTDPGVDRATVWAPDGSRLVFSANRTGVYDLFEKVAGSTGNGRVVFTSPANKLPADWSPDGNVLLFVSASSNTGRDLWALPLSGAQRPFPAAVQTPANEDEGQFSPDGKWIAFTSDESEMDEIYLEPFPPSGNRSRVSPAGGGQPRWRRDGTELFYIARDGKLMAVPIDLRSTGKTPVAGAPVPLFATRLASRGARKQQYAVAKDGQRFLMNVAVDEATRSPITIVQNWMAGLK